MAEAIDFEALEPEAERNTHGAFKRGDLVTVLPPYDGDPVIVSMQHYGRVAAADADGYTVILGAVWPPDRAFGPFPAERLAPGWRMPKPLSDWWVRT
jgi:hypothetical protein